MFSRLATLALPIAALAAVVAAGPAKRGTIPASQCNTGDLSCCNQVESASDPTVTTLASLLGIVLGPVDALVGLSCTPITVIGTGSGATCTQQPVCCTDNNYNGLINVGCSPVDLNA
ncbi:hydrophobin 2 [Phlebopus sp. FC_14]|nr:hydrophobin 2 [Phlebopus sp. FC_14]